MDKYEYEFKMDTEFDNTRATGGPSPSLPQIENNSRYYKETVAPQKKKGGILNFIIVGVIISLIAAPLLGLSIGAGQTTVNYLLGVINEETAVNVTEPVKSVETAPLQPVASTSAPSPIVDVVKKAKLSVVNITTSVVTNDYFYRYYFYGRNQETPGSGTGIVFAENDDNVYIMTNYHVIENANKAFVSFIDREQIQASLVGSDKSEDVAVISVKKADLAAEGVTDITIAKIGDSSKIEVGEGVVAIGNALGNGKTVTYGIISAINKEMDFNDGNKALNFIQTDAAINPGNSGGALVNMNGDVIGMNTAKIADYRVDGMGFAIPINSVISIANAIVENKHTEVGRPFIGVSGTSITDSIVDYYSLIVDKGVIIESVFEGGGASDAGLRGGDIVIEFGGQKITTIEQLQKLVSEQEIGANVNAKIIRNNEREVDVIIKIKDQSEVNIAY